MSVFDERPDFDRSMEDEFNDDFAAGAGDMSVDDDMQHEDEGDESVERDEAVDRSHELPEDQWRALAWVELGVQKGKIGAGDKVKIVRDVGPNLSPDEELGDLAAAEEAVNAKDNERAEVLDRLQNDLRLLTKQHQLAAQAAQRPAGHPSPAEHEAQVRSLEQQQYSTGKQLNEEQVSLGKREGELSRWRADKEEISKVDVGADDWVDGRIIRLKLFSGAGFSLIDSDSGISKVLVRNDAKPDVHTVSIDNPKQRVYYSNLLWNMASD